jgi:ketol-acid reductoisomerase
VLDTNDAAAEADVVVVLAPDTARRGCGRTGSPRPLEPGDALVFGHGFNVHYG